jgi:hypothetical protein
MADVWDPHFDGRNRFSARSVRRVGFTAMTDGAWPAAATDLERAGRVDAAATRVLRTFGGVVALDLDSDLVQPFLDRVDLDLDEDRTTVRLVLGAACTTAARAVDQFVAALQLPYPATRGWEDLLDYLGDGSASRRMYVVVADAAGLLRYEETDVWHGLVAGVKSGPHCLGGGFTTLVLLDGDHEWSSSRFGSAAATEEAAKDGWRHAAPRRYVRGDLYGD